MFGMLKGLFGMQFKVGCVSQKGGFRCSEKVGGEQLKGVSLLSYQPSFSSHLSVGVCEHLLLQVCEPSNSQFVSVLPKQTSKSTGFIFNDLTVDKNGQDHLMFFQRRKE